MNINYVVLGLLSLVVGFYSWKAYFHVEGEKAPNFLPWVPIDVRKNKVYVSQTKDASMFTERSRRLAVLTNPGGTFSYKGSTNGYVDSLLTGICFCPKALCPYEFELDDGGYYDADVCNVLDGMGSDPADFGNAFTENCNGVCPPYIYETEEGGNVDTEVCDVLDGQGTDVADLGGAPDVNVC
jgi:hypothetical protein